MTIAVDRGPDDGVLEVDLVHAERGLRLAHLGLGRLELGLGRPQGDLRRLELGLGDEIVGRELARAPELRRGIVDGDGQPLGLRLGAQQVGARLLELRLEQGRIEAHDDVAFARTIELKSTWSSWMMPETWLPTCTVVTRLEGPGRTDRVDDVAAGNRDGADLRHELHGSHACSSRKR